MTVTMYGGRIFEAWIKWAKRNPEAMRALLEGRAAVVEIKPTIDIGGTVYAAPLGHVYAVNHDGDTVLCPRLDNPTKTRDTDG